MAIDESFGLIVFQNKAPVLSEPWEGVREATAEGNICGQIDITSKEPTEFQGGEDCLYINVYTPSLDTMEKKPVMVWIHGGGYKWGSGNSDMYGPDYLVEKDVIVVTLNYRLNVLGFLCLNIPDVPGNAGLKDQVLALRWIKENISNFGGDENNITVFGESAGGAATSFLAVSPSTKGLINKAVIQSGTFFNRWSYASSDPIENARDIAKEVGYTGEDNNDLLAFLQTVPVKELVEKAHMLSPGRTKFGPVVEKEFLGVESFLTECPTTILNSGRFAKIPVLIGYNSLEGGWFLIAVSNGAIDKDVLNYIPKELNIDLTSETAVEVANEIKSLYFGDADIGVETLRQYLHLMGDIHFSNPIRRFIDSLIEVTEEPVFEYRFSYYGALNTFKKLLDDFNVKGASHADEYAYLFAAASHNDIDVNSHDVLTKDRMVELWTNFAKFGNPTPDNGHFVNIKWLPVTKDKKHYLDINTELTLSTNQDTKRMEFWRSIYAKYAQPPCAVARSESAAEVSSAPVVVDEQLVQLADEQELGVQSAPKMQEALEIEQEMEIQKELEIQNELQVKQEPELREELQMQQKAEVQKDTEVQQDIEAQQEANLQQESEIQQVPEIEQVSEQQKPEVLEELEEKLESEVQERPEVQHEAEVLQKSEGEQEPEEQEISKVQQEIIPQEIGDAQVLEVKESLIIGDVQVLEVEESSIQSTEEQGVITSDEIVENIDDSVNTPSNHVVDEEVPMVKTEETPIIIETLPVKPQNGFSEQNGVNTAKIGSQTNGSLPNVIRANDPPEDDLPKNIGVNKFVNFFESLGGKKVQ